MNINFGHLINLISIISLISSLFIDNPNLQNIYLLPLGVLLCNNIFYNLNHNLKNSIVYKSFLIQSIIRYTIIPILSVFDDNYLSGNSSSYTDISIFIMLVELILIYLVSLLISIKYKQSFNTSSNKILLINIKFKYIVILIICILLVFMTGYSSKINFIWTLNDYVNNKDAEEISGSAVGLISFNFFRILFITLLVGYIYKNKKIKDNKKIYYYLFIVILSSLTIIGVSRLSMVFFTLPFLILITYLISNTNKNKLYRLFALSFLPIIIYTSIAKFSTINNNYSTDNLFSTRSINAYFSGIGNVNTGIDLYYNNYVIKEKDNTIILNDYFQNIPILSNFTTNVKSSILYNFEIYGIRDKVDQIVPLSISGILHFGILGSFIYSPFFIYISYVFERKSIITKNILIKYIYISLSISTSMVFMLNIGSIISNIIKNIFFVVIPYKLTNIFK